MFGREKSDSTAEVASVWFIPISCPRGQLSYKALDKQLSGRLLVRSRVVVTSQGQESRSRDEVKRQGQESRSRFKVKI